MDRNKLNYLLSWLVMIKFRTLLFLLILHSFLESAPVFPLWHFSPSPENQIGTLTSSFGLEMISGSKLIIKVDNEGHSDCLQMRRGELSIQQGSFVEVVPINHQFQGYPSCNRYTIVSTATTIQGHFDGVCVDKRAHFKATLLQTPQKIELILSPLYYSVRAPSGNGRVIGQYLDCIGITCPSFERLFCLLDQLEGCALNLALEHLQPSQFGALALAQENTHGVTRSAFTHRLQEVYTTSCKEVPRLTLWGEPFGKFAHQSGTSNAFGFHQNMGGGILGFDYKPIDHVIVGIGMGGTHTSLTWEERGGNSSSDTGYLGLYGSWFTTRYAVDATFLSGYSSYDTRRHIPIMQLSSTHQKNGYELSGQLSFNLFFPYQKVQFQPVARGGYLTLTQKGYREKGAAPFDIKGKKKRFQLVRTELGLMASRCYGKWVPELGLSWIYERRLNSSEWKGRYVAFPETSFTVNVYNPNRHLAAPTAALTALLEYFYVSLRYTGEFNHSLSENNISGQVGWSF